MEKIYISGKIGTAGITPDIRRKFNRAEQMLSDAGFSVENPASGYYQDIMMANFAYDGREPTYVNILLYDLRVLNRCHAVYFLDDFEQSSGAQVEHSFAQATGKTMYFQDQEIAYINRDQLCDPERVDWNWLPILDDDGEPCNV